MTLLRDIRPARNGANGPAPSAPRLITLPVEIQHVLPELEELIRVGPPAQIVLHTIALDRLDDNYPGVVLEEHVGHLLVVVRPELVVEAVASLVAEAIPFRLRYLKLAIAHVERQHLSGRGHCLAWHEVVLGTSGTEQSPHHAV